MGRHGLAAWCLCALIAVPALADWGDWADPWTAVSDIVEATRERAEVTYTGTETGTAEWCGATFSATNRRYTAAAGLTAPIAGDAECVMPAALTGRADPIVVYQRTRALSSGTLVHDGDQTNTWTNALGVVTSEVYALYREDDRHVYTNATCEVVTSEYACAILNSNPAPYVSQQFMGYVDSVIWKLCDGLFVDDVTAPGLLGAPILTNWSWDGPTTANGVWIKTGVQYGLQVAALRPSNIWPRAGLCTTSYVSSVGDRGPTYPRVTTNRIFRPGWEMGSFGIHTVTQFVQAVAQRYVTTSVTRYYITKADSNYTAGLVLYGLACGRAGDIYEGRGLGAFDGPWRHNTEEGGYEPDAGGAVIKWGPYYNAMTVGGTTVYTRTGGSAYGPDGCWVGPRTGEISRAGAWVPTYDADSLAPTPFAISNALGLRPVLRVRSVATSEVSCAGVAEPVPYPVPLTVAVVGDYWLPSTPTSGWRLVTATQVVEAITADTTQALDRTFVDISSVTVTCAVWGSAYYPKDGLHVEVVWPDAPTTLYGELGDGTWMLSAIGLQERKLILQQLKWTTPAAAWTNAVTAFASSNVSSFGQGVTAVCPPLPDLPGSSAQAAGANPFFSYDYACQWRENVSSTNDPIVSVEASWSALWRQASRQVMATDRLACEIDQYTRTLYPADSITYADTIVGRTVACAPCGFTACGSSGFIATDLGAGCSVWTNVHAYARVYIDYPAGAQPAVAATVTRGAGGGVYSTIQVTHTPVVPAPVDWSTETWDLDNTCVGYWDGLFGYCQTGPFETRVVESYRSRSTVARLEYTVDALEIARWSFRYR